jgi:hypothetical protein
MSQPSKKFSPTKWSKRLVPILLIILLFALVATLVIIALAVLGLTPTSLLEPHLI